MKHYIRLNKRGTMISLGSLLLNIVLIIALLLSVCLPKNNEQKNIPIEKPAIYKTYFGTFFKVFVRA